MTPYFSNGSEKQTKNRSIEELREYVAEGNQKSEKIVSKIKEMTLSGNFDEDKEVKSTNYQAMTGMIDDLFRVQGGIILQMKNTLREKQNAMVELMKARLEGMDALEYEGKIAEFEDQLKELVLLANGISEEAGNIFAGLFEILKDTGMSTYYINSIHSEFDIKLSETDAQSLVRPGIKMQIFRIMKPAATHRFVPQSGEGEKSGVTTYQQMLEQAIGHLRDEKKKKEADKLREEIGEQIRQRHVAGKFDYEDEETVVTVSGPVAVEENSDNGDEDLPTLVTTQEELLGQARVLTLRPDAGMFARPAEKSAHTPNAEDPKTDTKAPVPLVPQVTVVKDQSDLIPVAEISLTPVETKPAPEAPVVTPAPKSAPRDPVVAPAPKPEAPRIQTPPAPKPEAPPAAPAPVIKKTRSKIWALLGAGAALAAAAVFSQTGGDETKNVDSPTVTHTQTAIPTATVDNQNPAPDPVEIKTVDNQKKAPKFTVNTDHTDFTAYASNFNGMHAFLADLKYAASHSEFELKGNESANQIKLVTLRGFLESGIKTATSAFARKAFTQYLSQLDHLENEIKEGRLDAAKPDFMKDSRYHQIRLMAEGIKNVVPAAPPENIAGYKIDKNNCHPLAVFTHNYLREGGAPAFHTTVMETLDNISGRPFERNDSGYVTNEFFERLHRTAAVRQSQNKVDGSPVVARSVEKYVRAGGRNEISEMLRGCVVPVYKDGNKAAPKENINTSDQDKAIPIKYVPSAPSPTGWNDSWGEKEDTDTILASVSSMLDDDNPKITVTGEEYMELEDEVSVPGKAEWNQSWGEKEDTDAILGRITAMVDDEEIELTDADIITDDDEIELTDADIITDDEEAIELTDADIITDDDDEIELTDADIIADDDDEIELTEDDFIADETPPAPRIAAAPAVPTVPEKKGFFARAALKVKSLFA